MVAAILVHAIPPVICNCKVVRNQIAFCPLHESAGRLLATCDHLRKFLKVAEQKDENMLRQVILPYLDRQIAAAAKR